MCSLDYGSVSIGVAQRVCRQATKAHPQSVLQPEAVHGFRHHPVKVRLRVVQVDPLALEVRGKRQAELLLRLRQVLLRLIVRHRSILSRRSEWRYQQPRKGFVLSATPQQNC